MLRYLTGEDNVRGHSNENYARELMELFCLGVRDEKGRLCYTEVDVKHLAKAFTGWTIDEHEPRQPEERVRLEPVVERPQDRRSACPATSRPTGAATRGYQAARRRRRARPEAARPAGRRRPTPASRTRRTRGSCCASCGTSSSSRTPDATTMNDLVKTYLTPRAAGPACC